jgi:hypothetical protein
MQCNPNASVQDAREVLQVRRETCGEIEMMVRMATVRMEGGGGGFLSP